MSNSPTSARPNLVYICSDQHSFRFTGYAGHPLVQTPNLDRIARQGVTFTNAYCGSPVCVPSRACLMTGMYPSDCGSFCNSTVWDGSHPTWGTRLSNAGYDCRATGKMDLNLDFDMGFQETDTRNGHCRNPDILHAQVDPEAVTRRAFEAQDRVLREIASGKSEEELAAVFEGRLGPGLARVLASRQCR